MLSTKICGRLAEMCEENDLKVTILGAIVGLACVLSAIVCFMMISAGIVWLAAYLPIS